MTFSVKVDLWHKACLVINRKCSPQVPKEDHFAPTISLDSVCIGFLIAQMRGLDCVAADISSAYLTSFSSEHLYIVSGNELCPKSKGT